MSVAELLRTVAVRSPDATAITGDGRSVTFGQLDRAANQVANALIAAGVEPGDRVGFVDRNGTEYWETFLGALKAGAVLVPLNFRLSPAEAGWLVDDAQAELVVAGEAFAPLVTGTGRPVVRIGADGPDGYQEWLAAAGESDPGRDRIGAELVELIYSSGTTGRPKGVLVGADQLAWSVAAFGSCFDVDSGSRSLVPVPYYHVAGGGWALITLSRGGRIVQCREPTADSMLAQLVEHRATHTAMVPAVMQIITGSPSAREADFSALRQVVYGGSPITEPLLRASVATFGAELFQSYGLSETMGVTTLLGPDQHALDGDLGRLRSAGRAVPGIELDILDLATGKPLPPGESGEIVVRGPSVTAGYWRRPEATAESFTANGFFRTGDVGSLDEDGYLFIRDRVKDMIITGGENVYPAEVESVLAAHPAVADVAVVGVASERWGETPVAYVVWKSTGAADGAELIAFARDRLAHFKCPTAVTTVDELPRNPSGKILKRELRDRPLA
jgi:acyl-CoA synthetase (AMP-forming)/AMP-acid ligase II